MVFIVNMSWYSHAQVMRMKVEMAWFITKSAASGSMNNTQRLIIWCNTARASGFHVSCFFTTIASRKIEAISMFRIHNTYILTRLRCRSWKRRIGNTHLILLPVGSDGSLIRRLLFLRQVDHIIFLLAWCRLFDASRSKTDTGWVSEVGGIGPPKGSEKTSTSHLGGKLALSWLNVCNRLAMTGTEDFWTR